MPLPDPDDLLADLDPAQREAVTITSGPLCILAGAGSGKTRVISRRVAYALATGVVRPRDVLVVTFTDKAAGEMAGRLAALGHRGVAASTFHAAALRQLRHFWPRVHGTRPARDPRSKVPILAPLAAGCPAAIATSRSATLPPRSSGPRRAASRRRRTRRGPTAEDRERPLPPDLMAGLYRRYETAKTRAGRIDFEDMLERTIELIEADESIAVEVRDRYRWFSVDEYQDTNPLQAALLDAWLGGREDLAVVGDEDQTIYTFTGATSDYLTGSRRATRPPGSSASRPTTARPRGLELANRVLAAGRTAADEREPGPRRDPRNGWSPSLRRDRSRRSADSRPTRRSWPGDDRRDPGARCRRHPARRDRGPRPHERPAARDRERDGGGRDPVPRPRRTVLRAAGGAPRGPGRGSARPRRPRRASEPLVGDWRPRSRASSASDATRFPTARPPANDMARS